MKLPLAWPAVALLLFSRSVSAHPGHGDVKVLSGALTAVEAERIQINVFDQASLGHLRVWVIVDNDTKIEAGKTRLAVSDLRRDQEVDCMAETEEGKDGATDLRALRIRVKKAR